ncbi:fumarate reductase/succinate dehydrogenase flavoprotein-like FrdA [Catellatospora sp. TT07R-123]|uniref:fumarate reductase/succinate dehydrogenase flavoprotein subunit n=1 Tax=Catellatospora sp. TT07R-123 TaxID=2733863 RepID=UPI001B096AA1|nr:fumarate reductase/succinate dehydrogenase flavoprotein subunit [Catellatospora sp. TT07R-123]GHJ42933.1 fumarate reductase/succinate dehydrogenase flavoprotein-like FrdA [Catellatospora sp. TT07R-123]
MQPASLTDRLQLDCDVVVVGGGTAGTMAALSAAEHGARVIVLEKAHVRHSGALAMGMDGVNNAVIPGKAVPEDYVREITLANDGIVNQKTVYQTASRGYDMVRRLEGYGVKFEKDAYGEYAVRQVHRSGSYVLPMPEGRDIKKVLYRVLRERRMRDRIRIENRLMPVRVLTAGGRAAGVAALHTRTGEFATVSARAVILATGASGRLGLPASGYLYGTYENPTNAGDGHSMAYHAGAELSGIECFQINPLIKDYNGPACAYVANPFGGYQVNNRGQRFVDSDYWSGQMMAEVARELGTDRAPVYLKLTHLPEETISRLEAILHTTERPTRGTFHAGRGHDYRTHDVEMHISEIGLCGGHSASGVWVDEHGATTVPGLYAAGDLACVPHNYMIGAFVFGDLAGTHAAGLDTAAAPLPLDQIEAAHELVYRPLRNPDGLPQQQVEYKLRRFVNEYVAPPKSAAKLDLAVEAFERIRADIDRLGARTPHELMRCVEVTFIRDCAEMAARASLTRTESRWGLYHQRLDHTSRDDEQWLFHLNLRKGADGRMEFLKRPVADYLVPVDGFTPVAAPPQVLAAPVAAYRTAVTGPAARATTAKATRRLLEVVRLAEQDPALDAFEPYLADEDPEVRRTALVALVEAAPPGTPATLVRALSDQDQLVRAAAVAGLQELADVLPTGLALHTALGSTDPTVRAIGLDLLRLTGEGTAAQFRGCHADDDVEVRLKAVLGLVRLDDGAGLAQAAADPDREVRVAVAHGLRTVGAPEVLARLAVDAEPLVRAAAFASAAAGPDDTLTALALGAVADPAWQVRAGAAAALGPAAAAELTVLATDVNADVRKAAVRAMAPHRDLFAPALADALADGDADVRAYARHALGGTSHADARPGDRVAAP